MKRKSLAWGSDARVKWHAVLYAVFVIGIWWGVILTINYEGNALVPFSSYKALILNRVGVTIFWGLFLLLHMIVHQIHAWSQAREIQSHLSEVTALQERYRTGTRLDLDAQTDELMLTDEARISDEQIDDALKFRRR